MALSGSVSTNRYNDPQYGERVGMTCTWTGVQDQAKNVTVISWTLASDGSKDFEYYTGNVKLTFDGIVALAITSRFLMQGGGKWSRSGTVEVPHEPDGSKEMTVRIEAGIYAYGSVNCTGEETFILDEIPRASTAIVPDFTIGAAGDIAISPAAEGFTHRLLVELGEEEYEITSGVVNAYRWTPDAEIWAVRIRDAASAACEMVVETWDGTDMLGDNRYPFTLRVPVDMVPVIEAFTLNVQEDPAGWGLAIKGITKVSWNVDASGVYGSEIVSIAVSVGGLRGSGASGSGLPAVVGETAPTATVTDSRGRTATMTLEPVKVYDYTIPAYTGAEAYRCSVDGTKGPGSYARVKISPVISTVDGRNAAQAQYRRGDGAWTAFDGDAVLSGFAVDKSHTVSLRVTDSLGGISPDISIVIPTDTAAFHLRDGGKGGAFGKYAEQDDLLDVAWGMRVRGEVQLDKPYFTTEDGETEWLFPPMEAGVEYRTAERFLGKPVYRKLIAHQFTSGLSGSQSLKIPHGITGLEMALRVDLISAGHVFPYVTGTTSLVVTECDASEITLTNAGSSWTNTARIWYFDISYLKEETT